MNLFSLKKNNACNGDCRGASWRKRSYFFCGENSAASTGRNRCSKKTKAQAVNFTVEWPIFGPKQVERFVKPMLKRQLLAPRLLQPLTRRRRHR